MDHKIKEAKFKLKGTLDKQLVTKNINYFCNLAKKKIQELNPRQKQQFLNYLVDKIILDSNNKKAKVVVYLPIKPEDVDEFFSNSGSSQNKFRVMSPTSPAAGFEPLSVSRTMLKVAGGLGRC